MVLSAHAFVPAVKNQARFCSGKLFSTAEKVAEGLVKTVTKEGRGMPIQLGDIATVKYSCYLPNEPKMAPFSKARQQKVVCYYCIG
jgi:hypothetical protein